MCAFSLRPRRAAAEGPAATLRDSEQALAVEQRRDARHRIYGILAVADDALSSVLRSFLFFCCKHINELHAVESSLFGHRPAFIGSTGLGFQPCIDSSTVLHFTADA